MDEGIYMSKQGQLVYCAVSDFLAGKLSRKETAELLGVRERTVARIARRIEAKGLFAMVHGNRGRTPWNKKHQELRETVMQLVRDKYFDFNMTHCLEKLRADHGLAVSYETLRGWCHEENLVKRRKRRLPKARYRRARMQSEGLLLQMDGSPHRYNGRDTWCLIAAIDDATSDIPYAEFFHSEDTINCMTVLQKIIEKKGVPYALYVDKAGCLGGSGKRSDFTQFGRAAEELGMRIIFASSPEAKGRIERTWATIQDRLIPEMRLRKIHRMPAANDYLQTQFLPNYWKKRNTVAPVNRDARYSPLHPSLDLREVLCLKEYRTVKKDHTLSWNGVEYALTSPLKHSIYRQKIEIRTYQDLTWRAYFADKPIEITPLGEARALHRAA